MIAQLDNEQIKLRPTRALARIISHTLLQGRPLTTKARWLNNILLPQYNLVKKLPQLRTVQKPIFILGTGRSGTTILGQLLSLHPQLCFLNEPKAMWHAIHPAEDLIGSYSRGPATYRLNKKDTTPKIVEAAHRLYGYALTVTHSKRILDKYPELIFRIPFITTIFPDAKLLFLVRDGWNTSQSIEKWSQNEGIAVAEEQHDWWGADQRKWKLLIRDIVAKNANLANDLNTIANFTRQTDMAAVEWIVTMQEGLNYLAACPQGMLKIHYEQLVAEPQKILGQLLDFCDLPEDQILLDYAQRKLRTTPEKESFTLHPAITPLFESTMAQLGYKERISR